MVIDVIRALARRWYVVLAGFLATAAMVFGAYSMSPPEYNARALVLLLPPRSEVGLGGNPLLQLDGLEQPAGILAAYFSSAPAAEEVKAISTTAEYTVGIDDSTRGPVLVVDVTDDSKAATLDTLDYLLQRIPEQLASLQHDVDARGSAVVGSMALTVDRQPEPDIRGTLRIMIAALLAGIIGTSVLAFAFDGFMKRRELRKMTGASPSAPRNAPPENTQQPVTEDPALAPVDWWG